MTGILIDPAHSGTGWHLRRKAGPLRFIRPLEEQGLFRRFAYLEKEESAVVAFANEFGFLGLGLTGPPQLLYWEEDVHQWWAHIDHFRGMINLIDAENQSEAAKQFNEYVQPLMAARVNVAPLRRPTLQMAPTTLLAAMWLQVAGELTHGTKYKRCEWCPTWWSYGKGTGHKENRRFCSQRCQKAWNRRQQRELQE